MKSIRDRCVTASATWMKVCQGKKDAKPNNSQSVGGDSGKSSFENVTAQLLTIVLAIAVDYDGDGVYDTTVYARVPIFDDMLENEYWEYDNHGLKLLQVRFYPGVVTDVSQTDLYLPAL